MAVDPTLVRDVVIVVPGIMGSELRTAQGSKVWSVGAGALVSAIRSFGDSLTDLELPEGIGDGHPGDGVVATDVIGSLHVIPGLWSPITGYDGLMDFLGSERFHLIENRDADPDIVPNLVRFPYDWRLSNRYNGKLLAVAADQALTRWRTQPGMDDAKLILVCHSMGGLVARWFAEREGGAEMIRAIVTVGTPHRGAVNAVETLVNGLSPGVWRARLELSDFVRSLPSLHQLLPTYDCLVTAERRTDLVSAGAPGLDTDMVTDAVRFHEQVNANSHPTYTLHKVVGIRQPTLTTVEISGGVAKASLEIDGKNQGGDGTVPVLSAQPEAERGSEVHSIAEQHGSLQGTTSLHDLVDGLVTQEEIIWQTSRTEPFGVAFPDVVAPDLPFEIRVTNLDDRRMWVTITDETGAEVGQQIRVEPDGTATVPALAEGGYRAAIQPNEPRHAAAVTKAFLVMGDNGDGD